MSRFIIWGLMLALSVSASANTRIFPHTGHSVMAARSIIGQPIQRLKLPQRKSAAEQNPVVSPSVAKNISEEHVNIHDADQAAIHAIINDLYTNLPNYVNVQSFCIENAALHDLEDCQKVLNILHNMPNLRTLILKGVGRELPSMIWRIFTSFPHLKTLDLSGNNIDEKSVRNIFSRLLKMNQLEVLNFSGNEVNDAVTILAQNIYNFTEHFSHIQALDLSDDFIGFNGLKSLANALPLLKNIRTLRLNGNILEKNDAIALAGCWPRMSSLEVLELQVNPIDDDGVIELATKFPAPNRLQILNLRNVRMTANGAAALGNFLRECPNLQALNVDYNDIGNRGAVTIIKALAGSRKIRELHLKGTEIDDQTIAALDLFTEIARNLQILDLSSNFIKCKDPDMLIAFLSKFPGLRQVNLKDNEIPQLTIDYVNNYVLTSKVNYEITWK